MSVRSDIQFDVSVSPRIITVLAPSQFLDVQDLLDTVRDWEDDPINMSEPKMVNAAGKDDLGGGLEVRITVILLDAKVTFEDRSNPDLDICRIEGGNLVALDSGGLPIDPVETSIRTQIIRTNTSSSTPAL